MKTPRLATLVATISLLALPCGICLKAAQPEMNEAIEQLEHAKKSEHPIEHLEKAKHELEDAKHNKHGERKEAIHAVNEAIEAAKKGEHHRMEEHIEHAIKEVREGKAEARK